MFAFTLQLFTFPFVVNQGRMQRGLHKHNIKNGRSKSRSKNGEIRATVTVA